MHKKSGVLVFVLTLLLALIGTLVMIAWMHKNELKESLRPLSVNPHPPSSTQVNPDLTYLVWLDQPIFPLVEQDEVQLRQYLAKQREIVEMVRSFKRKGELVVCTKGVTNIDEWLSQKYATELAETGALHEDVRHLVRHGDHTDGVIKRLAVWIEKQEEKGYSPGRVQVSAINGIATAIEAFQVVGLELPGAILAEVNKYGDHLPQFSEVMMTLLADQLIEPKDLVVCPD